MVPQMSYRTLNCFCFYFSVHFKKAGKTEFNPACFNLFPKGVTYDHVELNLYLNGKNMHCPASGIRGTVYPVVYGKQIICC